MSSADAFKNFDAPSHGARPSFMLAGDVWPCRRRDRMAWATWQRLLTLLTTPGDLAAEMECTRQVLTAVVVPERREEFNALLSRECDDDEYEGGDYRIVSNAQVRELLDWILHTYGARREAMGT